MTVSISSSFFQSLPDVAAVAVDPRNPANVYFVGLSSATGFYKSADGGISWSAVLLPGFSPYDLPAGRGRGPMIAIDPVATNHIYLSDGSKVFSSEDSGTTWTSLTSIGAGVLGINFIATDPKTSGIVYAIYSSPGNPLTFSKSTDFGKTWATVASPVYGFGAPVGPIFIDPGNGQIYLGHALSGPCYDGANYIDCGLFKSNDAGRSWRPLPLPGSFAHMSFDTHTGAIYAGGDQPGIGAAVFKSSDQGGTWTPLKNGFLDVISGPSVFVDPGQASTVYAVGYQSTQYQSSTDGGTTWKSTSLPPLCPFLDKSCPSLSGSYPAPYNPPLINDLAFTAAQASSGGLPSISQNGVVNGAGFQTGIVPNSWATIFGANLASATDDWSKSIVNGQFPTVLDGVTVTIGGKPAYIYYVTPGQLNVLVPDVSSGQVQVTVTNSGGTSTAFTVTSSLYGPAFFPWPNNQPVATRQDFSLAAKNGTFAGAATVPAKPGDIIILWGTGFGPTVPSAPVGVAVPSGSTYSTATLPAVTINNVPATVFGAALAPGFAGLYQVAIQVPSSIADGDWPIQATIGGVPSPTGVVLSVRH